MMPLNGCTDTKETVTSLNGGSCPAPVIVKDTVAQCWAKCSGSDFVDFTNQQIYLSKYHATIK